VAKAVKILLCGGLGNQLFEYAFGRAFSLRAGMPLTLDAASLFSRDFAYQRHYELDAFCIPDEVKIGHRVEKMHRIRRKMLQWRNHTRGLESKTFVQEEKPYRFESELRKWVPKKSVTFLGCWQCENYFVDDADQIRKELRFRTHLTAEAESWKSKMEAKPSVAVHMRRVQYARTLSLAYYEQAIGLMRAQVPGCRFYVFSDDPETAHDFARQQDNCVFVQLKDQPSIHEFQLMTHCQHFIIANSSFSWWAAWLGEKPQTQVIAPSVEIWEHPTALPQRWASLKSNCVCT